MEEEERRAEIPSEVEVISSSAVEGFGLVVPSWKLEERGTWVLLGCSGPLSEGSPEQS